MPKWFTTSWRLIDFDLEYRNNSDKESGSFSKLDKETHCFFLHTPYKELHAYLRDFTSNVDAEQFEIKSVMPLTTSIVQFKSVYGSADAYGYGVSQITGMAILLQKEEDISEVEYQKRNLEVLLPKLRNTYAVLKAAVESDGKDSPTIIERDNIFGITRYHVAGLQCKTREEAESHAQKIQEQQAELEKAMEALAKAENELEALQR